MYTCMCVCVCVCMRRRIHTHMRLYAHVCVYACVCRGGVCGVCACVCARPCARTCAFLWRAACVLCFCLARMNWTICPGRQRGRSPGARRFVISLVRCVFSGVTLVLFVIGLVRYSFGS